MGTNYYVTKPHEGACEHCGSGDQIHLGKGSYGRTFLFKADENWIQDRYLESWISLAASGKITNEYGGVVPFSALWDMIIGHMYETPPDECVQVKGHWFSTEEFS